MTQTLDGGESQKSAMDFINPPLQQRSRESLDRVLRAGLSVLQDEGFEGFTVQKVSRRANVSIGSIYARVSGRESLILAIYEWAMAWTDEAGQEFEELADPELDDRENIEAIVAEFVRFQLGHAAEWRIFARQAPVHSVIFARGQEKTHALKARFERALLSATTDIGHDDPQRAIAFVFSFVFSSVTRRISHGADFDDSVEIDDESLARELGRAAAAYLLGTR